MTNPYYTKTGKPATNSNPISADMRNEFALIEAGFDKLPALASNALKILRVNGAESAVEAIAPATLLEQLGWKTYQTSGDETNSSTGATTTPSEFGGIALAEDSVYDFEAILPFDCTGNTGLKIVLAANVQANGFGIALAAPQTGGAASPGAGHSARSTAGGLSWTITPSFLDVQTSPVMLLRGVLFNGSPAQTFDLKFGIQTSTGTLTLFEGATLIVRRIDL